MVGIAGSFCPDRRSPSLPLTLLVTFDGRISKFFRDHKHNDHRFMIIWNYEFMKLYGLSASALVPDFFLAHLDSETPDRPQD
jgi:hypothetical protein